MKRETAKMVLIVGAISLVIGIVSSIKSKNPSITSIVLIDIGVISLITGWWGWNSKDRKLRREELRKAQLDALNRGNVNVELKGKIRKLK